MGASLLRLCFHPLHPLQSEGKNGKLSACFWILVLPPPPETHFAHSMPYPAPAPTPKKTTTKQEDKTAQNKNQILVPPLDARISHVPYLQRNML